MEYTKKLKDLGFTPGRESPCCFHRSSDGTSVVVHGDDFVFEGYSDAFHEIVKKLSQRWIIKVRATLGLEDGDDKEVSILNRIVRWNDQGIESMRPIPDMSRSFSGTWG